MAITREQIFAAADALEANGLDATLDSVRGVLGMSTETLADLLPLWEAMTAWTARRAKRTQLLREPMPIALTQRLDKPGAELWRLALKLASERLAAERKELDDARIRFSADIERAAVALARAEELEKCTNDLNAELAHVCEQIRQLATAITTARSLIVAPADSA